MGRLLAVDGPRTDVNDSTSFAYYADDEASCASSPSTCAHRKGDLLRVTNALGQATEYLRYDTAGRVLSVKAADGVVTDLEYSSRGWLVAQKIRGNDLSSEADDSITRLDYDGVGQIVRMTEPDGVAIRFTYDDAHRLTDIADALNNKMHFALNNAGARIGEETRDGGGVLKRSLSRVFNTLGQLQTLKDGTLAATAFTYDANGAVDTTTDPLKRV